MFKEKEARKNIPLSYLELVMDKLRYNSQVRIENAFRIKNAKNQEQIKYLKVSKQ